MQRTITITLVPIESFHFVMSNLIQQGFSFLFWLMSADGYFFNSIVKFSYFLCLKQVNEEMCRKLVVDHRITSAYHPQTNGLDESTNRNIKR